MKRIFLILLIAFNYSFSQCPITLNEFLLCKNYSFSDFDSFALKNGYSYNSNTKIYNCDDKINNNPNDSYNAIYRTIKDGSIVVSYTFIDKNEYLSKKTLLDENFELISAKNKNESLEYIFKTKNNEFIILMTNTILYGNKNINVYVLAIQ